MKLAPKFIGVSLLVALVPLAGVGVRVVRETDRSLRAAAVRLQHGLSARTADAVKTQWDGAVNLLTMAARNIDERRGLGTSLEPLLNTYPLLMDLWIYDGNGQERAALHRLGSSPGVGRSNWKELKKEIDERGYYAGPWETPEAMAPKLLMAVPRLNESNQTVGYLAARINLYVLTESLQGLDLESEGLALLVSKDGRLLAHSSPKNLFKIGFKARPEWIAPQWRDGEQLGIDGKPVLAARTFLPERGAWAFYFQPAEIALAPVTALKKRILFSLGLGAVFAVVLALILNGLIVRPLRQFHAALRQMKEGHFDTLVEVRSADELGDIAQAFREAQPVLEKRVRDSVLGKMSRLLGHDLRQPVLALRNSLDTIRRHVAEPDATTQEHLTLSREALDWIDDFIEDILTVGRERPLTPRRMALDELVRSVLAKIRVPAGITLSTQVAEGTPKILLDEREARKAVANVVKNALEVLGESGKVDLLIGPSGNGAALTVADNGPGIPEEKKSRLFEEFTTKDSGTGLGLLVVKRVMDRHSGRVEVDSSPQGTRVTLWFPVS